jgi:hypothetical protein
MPDNCMNNEYTCQFRDCSNCAGFNPIPIDDTYEGHFEGELGYD